MSSSSHHQGYSHTSAIPTGQRNSASQNHHHHYHNLQPVNNDERENQSIVSAGGGSGRTKNVSAGNSREGGSNNNSSRDNKERKRTMNNMIIRFRTYRALSRAIGISRAFFTWKMKVSLLPFLIDSSNDSGNTGVEGEGNGEKRSDSKANSYLTLFFENERLRQQLKEQQRSSKATRQHAGAASLACLLRSRRRMLCRAYLDRWIQMSSMEAHRSSHIQQATELKV